MYDIDYDKTYDIISFTMISYGIQEHAISYDLVYDIIFNIM